MTRQELFDRLRNLLRALGWEGKREVRVMPLEKEQA